MLLAMRGVKMLAPVIGFFEVLIWIFAVGNAIRFLDSRRDAAERAHVGEFALALADRGLDQLRRDEIPVDGPFGRQALGGEFRGALALDGR